MPFSEWMKLQWVYKWSKMDEWVKSDKFKREHVFSLHRPSSNLFWVFRKERIPEEPGEQGINGMVGLDSNQPPSPIPSSNNDSRNNNLPCGTWDTLPNWTLKKFLWGRYYCSHLRTVKLRLRNSFPRSPAVLSSRTGIWTQVCLVPMALGNATILPF